MQKKRSTHQSPIQAGSTLTGRLTVHRDGYGFVLPDDESRVDVFIPARFMGDALPDDRVKVSYHQKPGEKRLEGRVLSVLKRGRVLWVGMLEKQGKLFTVRCADLSGSGAIAVEGALPARAVSGHLVVVETTAYPQGSSPMRGRITKVLGMAREEEAEMASILVRHGIKQAFDEGVLEESKHFKEEISVDERKKRIDLTSLPIMTIDGIKARDFDDAVFAEKKGGFFHLYVSIADVAHYVTRHSETDREALARGTSVYFPDFAVPMLPEKLSNDLCSLVPGRKRRTLTCKMIFNMKGELIEAQYYESIILSRKRGVYEEVQSFFDGDSNARDEIGADLIKSLETMREVALLLMERRVQRGCIDFDLPEAEIIYNHEGDIEAITQAKRFFSHRLIEELMISANVAVASLFASLSVPALYRVHETPDENKTETLTRFVHSLGIKLNHPHPRKPKDFSDLLGKLKGHPFELLVHQLLLRSMKWAVYSPRNKGHFGLSLKNYCHFTSPIRRYPDLIVHRQLKELLQASGQRRLQLVFGNEARGRRQEAGDRKKPSCFLPPVSCFKSSYTPQTMESLGKQCSQRERKAMEAERETMDLKRVLFAQNHLGDKFFGIVRRVVKFGVFVELSPHCVEGLLHVSALTDDYYQFDEKKFRLVGRRHGRILSVGQKIWVVVKDVSYEEKMIRLAFFQAPNKKPHTSTL